MSAELLPVMEGALLANSVMCMENNFVITRSLREIVIVFVVRGKLPSGITTVKEYPVNTLPVIV